MPVKISLDFWISARSFSSLSKFDNSSPTSCFSILLFFIKGTYYWLLKQNNSHPHQCCSSSYTAPICWLKCSFSSLITSSFLCLRSLITLEKVSSTSFMIWAFFSSHSIFVCLISSSTFSVLSYVKISFQKYDNSILTFSKSTIHYVRNTNKSPTLSILLESLASDSFALSFFAASSILHTRFPMFGPNIRHDGQIRLFQKIVIWEKLKSNWLTNFHRESSIRRACCGWGRFQRQGYLLASDLTFLLLTCKTN